MPPFAWRPVAVIAAVLGVLLLAVSGRWGYFGDELYFVAAGRHLDWGYADQPPLLPLIARAMDALFPGSVVALRIPATLVTVGGIVLSALIARELGGERKAQVLSALAFATSLQLVASGHLLATSTLDPFLWTVILWLVVRWVRTRRDGLLLLAGLVTAVDLEVKYLVLGLWLAIGVGALVCGPRELPRRPLLWLGAAIAAVSLVPGVLWQASHGWPQLEMGRVIAAEVESGYGGRLLFLPLVLLTAGVLSGTVLLGYGLFRLLRAADLREYRFLGVAAVLVTALMVLTEGRYYYVAGLFPLLWAAGAVGLTRRRAAAWWRWTTSWPAIAVSVLVAVGLGLPVLPPKADNSTDLVTGGSIGWPHFVDTVAAAYRSLPSADRAHVAITTEMYWQASAIDVLGRDHGLPRAYSGNRGYWYFGAPPADTSNVLVVGGDAATLGRFCGGVHRLATVDNPGGFPGLNKDVPIWHCTAPRVTLPQLWPSIRQL